MLYQYSDSRNSLPFNLVKVYLDFLVILIVIFTVAANSGYTDLRWIVSETDWEPCSTPKMEDFAKIVNGWKPITSFVKYSILDVWQGPEYNSEFYQNYLFLHDVSSMVNFSEVWNRLD